MTTDETERLRADLSRATACLKAIEQELRSGCISHCACSATALTVFMARLLLRAWSDPEGIDPGHNWIKARLIEGSPMWRGYADVFGESEYERAAARRPAPKEETA